MSWHSSQEPGGGILGGHLLGWSTVCACEIEPYPRNVLLQRQRDGILPQFPIWDDVTTFDATPWRGLVDIVTGGFPCQDISCAGKGAGISGARSGLWSHMHRIICEVRPRFAFMENSPLLTSRGIHVVLGNLAEIGYHAAWLVLGAADLGAPHKRDRIWILAEDMVRHTDSDHETPLISVQGGENPQPCGMGNDGNIPHPNVPRAGWRQSLPSQTEKDKLLPDPCLPQCKRTHPQPLEPQPPHTGPWHLGSMGQPRNPWQTEPNVGRVADGVASRVDRLKAIGNGQVPLVAATAFTTLYKQLQTTHA